MAREAAMVVNPGAGSYDRAALDRMATEWPGLTVHECRRAGDTERLTRMSVRRGATLVIAAGGDGTVHQVVNGLADDFGAVALAILPLGTGNDFARTLGMPLDAALAVEAIRGGVERAVDLIRVGLDGRPRYCINSATGGFSIRVEEKLTPRAKSLLGPLAYLIAAARSADQAGQYETRLTFDDGDSFTLDTPNIAIANGRSVGGGYEVAPRALPDDGLLDFVAVTAQTLGQRLKLLTEYVAGEHLESMETVFRRARTIRIDSDPPMPFSLDGERTEGQATLTFEVMPRALRVLAPREGLR